MDIQVIRDLVATRVLSEAFTVRDDLDAGSVAVDACTHDAIAHVHTPFRLDFDVNEETGALTWCAVRNDVREACGVVRCTPNARAIAPQWESLEPIPLDENDDDALLCMCVKHALGIQTLERSAGLVFYDTETALWYDFDNMAWTHGRLDVVFTRGAA